MNFKHQPVLLVPMLEALLKPDFGKASKNDWDTEQLKQETQRRSKGIFIDGTFGRGGHARALLERLDAQARLLVFDKDPAAIEVARELAAKDSRVTVIHESFATMQAELAQREIEYVDGIMLDLGVSSPQLDEAERGFSFMRDGPLDMRMDTTRGLTAAQWLADASLEEIQEVIKVYGEERFAFQIAKTIIACRATKPICTTHELAKLVASTVRTREKGQHPATRTFQAIRIYINQELAELADALKTTINILNPTGRLAVISFHSLEDRLVKQCIATASRPQAALARLPIYEQDLPQPLLCFLERILVGPEEALINVRARSAVLRVAERTQNKLPENQNLITKKICHSSHRPYRKGAKQL